MKGAKQILLAGFAALCMVLPACHTAIPGEEFARRIPLVISSEPLNTVSYTAEYTQDGALPFTCEVKLGTDGRIRRDYVWKDEKGAERKPPSSSTARKRSSRRTENLSRQRIPTKQWRNCTPGLF